MSHHYSGPDYGFRDGDARLDLTDDLQDDLAGLVRCARKHALRPARLRKRQDRAHARHDSARVKQSCDRLQARGGHLSIKENGPCRQRLGGD